MHFKPNLINGKSPDWVGMGSPTKVSNAPLDGTSVGQDWTPISTTTPLVMELVAANKWRAICCYVAESPTPSAHGTDGYIPDHCLFLIHATKREANELVSGVYGSHHREVGISTAGMSCDQ